MSTTFAPARGTIEDRRHATIAAWLVVAMLFLGGGGTPNPLTEIALQLLIAAAALAWIWTGPHGPPAPPPRWPSHGLLVIVILVTCIPLLQLIPLPSAIWKGLSGRETQQAALTLIDADRGWRPLSISPFRTLASTLSLVPPLFAMLMVGNLSNNGRDKILSAIAIVGIATACIGAAQLSGGSSSLHVYSASHKGWVTGLMANRNAAADLLLISLVALAALYSRTLVQQECGNAAANLPPWVWLACASLLICATIMTGSRTGIALTPLALVGCWLMVRNHLPRWHERWSIAALITAIPTLLAAGLLLNGNIALERVFNRYGATEDFRFDLWRDTHFAISQYWPAGSGIGTFIPAIFPAESLETVDASLPNRAHNDYLEFILETGAAGLIVLFAIATVILTMAYRSWNSDRNPSSRCQIIFAFTALLVISIHSAVDYPMRSMTLASIAAIAVAMLAPKPFSENRNKRDSPR